MYVERGSQSTHPVDVGEDEAAILHDLQQPLLAAKSKHLGGVLVQAGAVDERQGLSAKGGPEMHQAGIVDLLCAGLTKKQQGVPASHSRLSIHFNQLG